MSFELAENFKCAICADYFDEPRMLPDCGHSFCTKCLIEVVKNRQQLECPMCRLPKPNVKSEQDVMQHLPINYALKSLKAAFDKQAATTASTSIPANADAGGKPSKCSHAELPRQKCKHCSERFCDVCELAHVAEMRRDLKLEAERVEAALKSNIEKHLHDSLANLNTGMANLINVWTAEFRQILESDAYEIVCFLGCHIQF